VLAMSCVENFSKKRPATMRGVLLQLIRIQADMAVHFFPSQFATTALMEEGNDIRELERDVLIRRYQEMESLLASSRRDLQQQQQQPAPAPDSPAQEAMLECCICFESQALNLVRNVSLFCPILRILLTTLLCFISSTFR
jgi:hypothetical protein